MGKVGEWFKERWIMERDATRELWKGFRGFVSKVWNPFGRVASFIGGKVRARAAFWSWLLVLLLVAGVVVTLSMEWEAFTTFMRETGDAPKDKAEFSNQVILRNLALGVAAILGVGFAWWRSWCLGKQTRVAEQGLITDRFIKATEQLGSDKESVRIGAIYSLWRIAVDSPEQSDKIAVLDVLCAFVRASGKDCELPEPSKDGEKKEDEEKESTPLPIVRDDIQIAMNLLDKKCCELQLKDKYTFDLKGAYLAEANLDNAQLEYAILISVHLKGAHLEGAHLEGAHLKGAHLEGAHLEGAHLEGAHLEGAHLEGAHLEGAHLEWAYLVRAHPEAAHLEGAYLEGAHLEGANLEGAYLVRAHLEGANLFGAHLERARFTNRAALAKANTKGALNLDKVIFLEDDEDSESA